MTKNRYEREIDEILERLERQGRTQTTPRQPQRPPAPRPGWRLPGRQPFRWSSGLWLALSIGLPVAATLVRGVLPEVAVLMAIVGILVFLSPLVTIVLRLFGVAPSPGPTRQWRGRILEMPSQRGDSLSARVRYWLWSWRQRWDRRR